MGLVIFKEDINDFRGWILRFKLWACFSLSNSCPWLCEQRLMIIKTIGKIMEVIKTNVVDRLKSEAAKEIQAEFEEKAKAKIKDKLRDLELAKKVVSNIERELEDLYLELSQ